MILNLHPGGQVPAQLIVVARGRRSWRCRRSAQVAAAAIARAAGSLFKSLRSSASPCQPTDFDPNGRGQAIAEAVAAHPLCRSQRFKAKSKPALRCRAYDQPVGAAGVGQPVWMAWGARSCSGVELALPHGAAAAHVVTPQALADTARDRLHLWLS